MPVPTVTMPYMVGSSVEVISTDRAHLKHRMTSMLAMGLSMLVRSELLEKSESEDE